jgi:broad-specificity NMP kinase
MHEYECFKVIENARTEALEAGVKDTYKQHDNDIIRETHSDTSQQVTQTIV